jgi:hypothetical protein
LPTTKKVVLKKKKLKIRNRFDPFADRTARNIRNTLSEAFVSALGVIDTEKYRAIARQWQKQNLSSLHAGYIDDRLLRYEQVFYAIAADDITDPLQQALIIWNQGLFFEFHDYLETLWQTATGDKRQALKGLIKAAGVYIHLEQHRQQAAHSLALKAHTLLQQYSHCLTFIANIETLLAKLKAAEPVAPRLDFSSFHD